MTKGVNLAKKFYSVQEVADMFQVTTWTVRELWIKPGKLGATKIGKQWRIPHDDLTKFANEKYGDGSD